MLPLFYKSNKSSEVVS